MSTVAEHTTKRHPGVEFVQEQVRIIHALTSTPETPRPLNIISAGRLAVELDDLASSTVGGPDMPSPFNGLLVSLTAIACLIGMPEDSRGAIRGEHGDAMTDTNLAWAAYRIGQMLHEMAHPAETVLVSCRTCGVPVSRPVHCVDCSRGEEVES